MHKALHLNLCVYGETPGTALSGLQAGISLYPSMTRVAAPLDHITYGDTYVFIDM